MSPCISMKRYSYQEDKTVHDLTYDILKSSHKVMMLILTRIKKTVSYDGWQLQSHSWEIPNPTHRKAH